MGHKSPFTDWVFEAWDKLVLSNGAKLSFDERWNGWNDLYRKTYIDGKWAVGLDDASMVASLGSGVAMERGEFLEARELCREFLAHPDLDHDLMLRSISEFYVWEAMADILCGNTEAGIARLRRPLFDPKRTKHYLHIVRNNLVYLLNSQGLGNQADPQIAALVGEVVGCFRGLTRLSHKVPSFQTNAELERALFETSGR